jgi:hypothetical protein
VDDEDMSGGVDSGVVIGGPGGMMGDLWSRWLKTNESIAEYDCECSQNESWRPVWTKNVCIQNWGNFYKNESISGCQVEKLKNLEEDFAFYLSCQERVNESFLNCLGGFECQNDQKIIDKCISDWNDSRLVCNLESVEIVNIIKECNYEAAVFDEKLLTLVYWESSFSSEPEINTSLALNFNNFNYFKSTCEGIVRCTALQLNFREEETYSSYIVTGTLGSASDSISETNENGIWRSNGNVELVMSSDCQSDYRQGWSMLAFQRIFFNKIYLSRADFIISNAKNLEENLNADDVCITD